MRFNGSRFAWRALALVGLAFSSAAQPPGPPPPRSAREGALVDLTGQWVAQITEDWRWRMITPPKGDYASMPLNAEGRRVADGWDREADEAAGEQCRAFGAGGLLRQPTRLRISWADDETMRLETDAGEQMRLLHFGRGVPEALAPTWQGHSVAEWAGPPPVFNPFGGLVAPNQGVAAARGGGGGAASGASLAPARGGLKVVTTRLRPGYLRKNGVPYGDRAVVTEYFDRLSLFGNDYLQVVTVVTDPVYLTTPFVVSNQFKLEPDGAKWNPTPCSTDAPRAVFEPPSFVQ